MKKEEKRGQMNIKDMFAKQSKRKAEESGGAPVAKKPKVCISYTFQSQFIPPPQAGFW